MRDILDIQIVITGITEVQGTDCVVKLITFDGTCQCENFCGKLLPGGVDLQTIMPDGTGMVSARYILEGEDAEGVCCKIYVENKGCIDRDGNMVTMPQIVTDSKRLEWLQKEKLCCRFEMRAEEFHVIICV